VLLSQHLNPQQDLGLTKLQLLQPKFDSSLLTYSFVIECLDQDARSQLVILIKQITEVKKYCRFAARICHFLATKHFPRTMKSIAVRAKHEYASLGVRTIGSFSFSEVFNKIGTPVFA